MSSTALCLAQGKTMSSRAILTALCLAQGKTMSCRAILTALCLAQGKTMSSKSKFCCPVPGTGQNNVL